MHIKKEIIHIVWTLSFVFLLSPSVSLVVRDAFFKFFYFKPTIYIVVHIILRSAIWEYSSFGFSFCWLFWYLISSTKFLLIFISQKSLTTIFLYNLLLTYHKPFPSNVVLCLWCLMSGLYSVWRSFLRSSEKETEKEILQFNLSSLAFFLFSNLDCTRIFELMRDEMNLINTYI